MTDDKKQFLYALAQEHNLQASAGSDFHSPGRWTEIGRRLSFDDALQPVWHDWSLITSERVS